MSASSSTEDARRAKLANAVFRPSAIALIGASADASRLTSRPERVLRRHGYAGQVFPIHPACGRIAGQRVYRSLGAVPAAVEHAYVMQPAIAVPQAIEECAAAGVTVVTILSAGFAETGARGRRRQDAIVATARAAGVRLIGPNCLGLADVPGRFVLSANAVFEHEDLRPGGLSLISQSGSMLGAIVTRAQERGLGFSRVVSVGNECDLAVGELAHLLVDDDTTRAILLFLETFRDAAVLAEAARRAFAAGKPVIAFKLGRSAAGREVAATHTGTLAGDDLAAAAFFRAHGILRVDTLDALFETAQLVLGQRPPRGRRVGALTVSGGAAALVVDRLGLAGVELAPPPVHMVERLATRRIRIARAPVIDLPMGRADAGAYAAILDELLASDHCDVILAVQGSNAAHAPESVDARVLAARRGGKPLAVFIGPRAEAALLRLQASGVAGFRTPESCADAIRAYCDWRAPEPTLALATGEADAIHAAVRAAGRGSLDELAASRLLAAVGIPCVASCVLPAGAALPGGLPYPLAVKILSADVPHKSDAGGVALDIAGPAELAGCIEQMLARVRALRPEARIEAVLVQPMQRGLGEAILGYRRDPSVGPIVLAGAGGIRTETSAGPAVRLAPVSERTAREMIETAPGLAPLRGWRSRPVGGLAALAQALHRLSLLACVESVLEAEVNPVIVGADAAVAVDAFVRMSKATP